MRDSMTTPGNATLKKSTSLIKSFFTCLYLLPRPHKRRLFMASIVRLNNRSPMTAHFIAYLVTALFCFLLFTILVFLLQSLGIDQSYYITSSGGVLLPGIICTTFMYLFIMYPYVNLFYTFDGSQIRYLLRYAYYARTPQFKDKTRRSQILILDTVRASGAKWSASDTLMLFVLFGGAAFAWFDFTYLSGYRPLFYIYLEVIFVLMVVVHFLNEWISPLGFNTSYSLFRKFLYNFHAKKNGSMPQEITNIVNSAWELYPDLPKKKKQPKAVTACDE